MLLGVPISDGVRVEGPGGLFSASVGLGSSGFTDLLGGVNSCFFGPHASSSFSFFELLKKWAFLQNGHLQLFMNQNSHSNFIDYMWSSD